VLTSNVLSVRRSEDGQAMVEYALILALIGAACFAALQAIGPTLTPIFQAVVDGF
jgi:Flp pilus assembly pilin Flp